MILFKQSHVLDYIDSYLPKNPIIIEAGAYNGSDTIRMAQRWPTATIHAFEPVPEMYKKLVANTAPYPNLHCYQLALSDRNGTAQFYLAYKPEKPDKPTQTGSLLPPKERSKYSTHQFKTTIEVPTITLDSWAEQHNMDHIDFAWLDIQGHELAVLQACPQKVAALRVIYCEVGFVEGYEGQPTYKMVKEWLKKRGFTEFGRDFKNTTDWFFGNVLFIKECL